MFPGRDTRRSIDTTSEQKGLKNLNSKIRQLSIKMEELPMG